MLATVGRFLGNFVKERIAPVVGDMRKSQLIAMPINETLLDVADGDK